MKPEKLDKVYRISSTIAFCAFCVLMANCTMFGTGNYLHALGISVLGVTVVLASVFSVPIMLRDFKKLIKNPYLWAMIAFAVWNVLGIVIGLIKGNPVGAIFTDINSVIYFVLFPVILSMLTSEKRLHILMRIMMYGSMVMGVLACALLFTYLVSYDTFAKLLAVCNYGYFLNFTHISHTIPRILFFSAPFHACGCAFAVYFAIKENRIKVSYVLAIGLSLFCMLMTYTRAMYLSALLAALTLAILFMISLPIKAWKKLWINVALGLSICFVILLGFSALGRTNYFGYALERGFAGMDIPAIESLMPQATEPAEQDITEPVDETLTPDEQTTNPVDPETTVPTKPEDQPGLDGYYNEDSFLNATVQSDVYRGEMRAELMEMIEAAPLAGHGFGAPLPRNRTNIEYSFLELAAKKGVMGVVLYLLPFAMMVLSIFINLWKKKPMLISCAWCAVLVGLMSYAAFHPYINNAPSTLLYCTALCAHWAEVKLLNKNVEE